eukprot:Hpha_TRINITY_DN24895_c0_g1::TRINITY_DN24895_c0_g1_i1::g.97325::m.97325
MLRCAVSPRLWLTNRRHASSTATGGRIESNQLQFKLDRLHRLFPSSASSTHLFTAPEDGHRFTAEFTFSTDGQVGYRGDEGVVWDLEEYSALHDEKKVMQVMTLMKGWMANARGALGAGPVKDGRAELRGVVVRQSDTHPEDLAVVVTEARGAIKKNSKLVEQRYMPQLGRQLQMRFGDHASLLVDFNSYKEWQHRTVSGPGVLRERVL